MRTIGIFASFFLFAAVAPALALDPTGDWRVADGSANIRIAQCNGSMWGVVAWQRQPGGRDINNPDPSKRNRPTLGMPILLNLKKKPGADQWAGQVYNAKNGQTYSSTITPIDTDHLQIRGCVLGFLCGGETWTRVGPPIPPSPANGMAMSGTRGSTTAHKRGTARSVASAARMAGPKRLAAHPTDPVGNICLLPDIARFAH
jgi:uncharacterized protein (DUF2147 family)